MPPESAQESDTPVAPPLAGVRVADLSRVLAGPYATMLLADMGAEVVTIDRTKAIEIGTAKTPGFDLLRRNRLVVKLDLKHTEAQDCALKLIDKADVAVSPGLGFGEYGEGYVRIALVENEHRIRQAARNIKKFLARAPETMHNVIPIPQKASR